MKKLSIYFVLAMSFSIYAQEQMTLQDCYQLLNANYPLVKQNVLLEKQNTIDQEVIASGKLPKFDLVTQATYQSDVIEVPIPNSNIEPLNKDQFRVTFSINQLIYNGGLIDATSKLKSAELNTRKKQLEVSIYQLKKVINQLYFSILLSEESFQLLKAKQQQLQAKLTEVKSGIKYGVLLPASDKVLEVELLKINQQFIEVNNNKMVLIETLSSLIGYSLDISTTFQKPSVEIQLDTVLNRPELDLFRYRKDEIESSKILISKQNAPRLLGFATGGYGNPGLNLLDNSFQTFYTVGVKLNWNVFDWNTNKKQREALEVNKDILDNEIETFNLNTNIELNQQQKEIEKIEAFITSDFEIIKLRREVLRSADSQLKNGVITSSAYITELTNLYEDENTLLIHNIQLQRAKANYNTIQGK